MTIPIWFAALVVISFTIISASLVVALKDRRERDRYERNQIERNVINAYNRGIDQGFRALLRFPHIFHRDQEGLQDVTSDDSDD